MELIASGLGDDVDVRAGIAAVARVVGRGLDLEFLNGIRIRDGDPDIDTGIRVIAGPERVDDGGPVHHDVVLVQSGAVHGDIRRGLAERGRVAYSAGGSRFQTHNRGVVPGGQRLVAQRGAIHDSSQRRFGGFQEFLLASTVTCSVCAPTSMVRSRTGVSVTLTVNEVTSDVLKPDAAKRTRYVPGGISGNR